MPWRIQNITSEAYQVHTALAGDLEVQLTLRFHPAVEIWTADVVHLGRAIYGVKLALNTTHFRGANYPFDLFVTDTSGAGVDPNHQDDFESERCLLYLAIPDEMAEIRGLEVPVV